MSRRTICETDYAGEARLLAAGYASLGVEVEIVRGRTRRYAVRERVRWDRAFLAWRKRFSQFLRGDSSVQSAIPPGGGRAVRLGAPRSNSGGAS